MTEGTNRSIAQEAGLQGERSLVVGLGREGRDLARFLMRAGATVTVTDSRPGTALEDELDALSDLPLHYVLGGHAEVDLGATDAVYVSPGVPPEIPFLREVRTRGLRVSSATELFFRLCPATILGITGSSGKSTTTAMTGSVLRAAGRDAVVGGNIGVPVLGLLDQMRPETWVVMELSSFQLEFMRQSPPIATITNITPNHLDRHLTMDAYRAAKEQILSHQQPMDWAVLNDDDAQSQLLTPRGRTLRFSQHRRVHGAYQRGDDLVLEHDGAPLVVCARSIVHLRGEHNIANALTVIATAAAAGVSPEDTARGIAQFRALPHRLEPVGTVGGATYYNDSIATAPERSMAALLAFSEPTVLLAGGRDKLLPMGEWAELIHRRCRHLVVFGEAGPKIHAAAREAGIPADRLTAVETLDQAVVRAHEIAQPGDAVLLSPGCTSYDAFFDFEARGERFRALVAGLAGR